MRITSMNIAGEPRRGGKLPIAFATISRPLQAATIKIHVALDDGTTRTWKVDADADADTLFASAQRLQPLMDGCVGTSSMIHDYFNELRRFADEA